MLSGPPKGPCWERQKFAPLVLHLAAEPILATAFVPSVTKGEDA
jgi:hypothetical protein